jgi:hypothetical protein
LKTIIDKAKESLSTAKEKITDYKDYLLDDGEKQEIIEEFKDSGQIKIKEMLTTLSDFTGLFKDAGYEIKGMDANISVPPAISVSFKCLEAIPESERAQIFTKAENNKVATIILKSLFKASDFSDVVKIGEFRLRSVTLKLGVIPGINISFL